MQIKKKKKKKKKIDISLLFISRGGIKWMLLPL